MKKYFLYAGLGFSLLTASCTKDFEEINTDPKQYTPDVFDANYFLSNSQSIYATAISGYSGPILFQSGWMQIFAMATTAGDYYTNADKYVASSNTNAYTGNSWNNAYRSASLANEILINRSSADSANITGAATIMKVLNMQYITDVYGDAPYSEAFQAREGLTLPVYDKQQSLYPMLLTELETALKSMDASKLKPAADISSLAGDVDKWKRFGYSLMLRMAMRLVKKDAAMAKTWAEKAYAGGTLKKGEDVYFKRDNANGYPNGNVNAWLVATDFYQVRWSKTLIDYLKAADDPRLSIIAEVPKNGLANNKDTKLAGDDTAAHQLGLPNGYDVAGGSGNNITSAPGYPGPTPADPSTNNADYTDQPSPVGKYSRPSIDVYSSRDIPVFVLTYAESELLLAEAAVRNWSVGASAAQHYQNAVAAGILALNAFKAGVVSDGTATNYAASKPLDVSSMNKSLEMINTQYWATTGILWNFGETWLNWKRSGYPMLTPVSYPGSFSGNTIPRRQLYPTEEATRNPDNYTNAASALPGGDTWTSKVWWDQ